MAKRHYIPVTAEVPGAASEANCALIRRTIRTALAEEGITLPCEVDVLLTDDEGINAVNREMRGVDRPTDVLSFPAMNVTLPFDENEHGEDVDPENGNYILGDIALCAERADEQAKEFGHSVKREVCYLVLHGLCHLFGFDHETEEDKRKMRKVEEDVLGGLGITR